ncbi:heterokaryon incompatibility protein-domain-containing protein [Phaeosphaeria sp. MPI-PUGE-AT-0046c]|nr:heterokaryon incompatibility protein-domain-containing protein [Phaeosphaeria sp. MPI-PUGE-AT-0046c]
MESTSPPPSDRTYLPFRGVKNDPALYSTLDATSRQIRYVDLHPGSGDDPVVCSLGYATLDPKGDDRLSYEALSYCWGSVDDVVYITLRVPTSSGLLDTTTTGNYRVTRNLKEALTALRYGNEMRRLWVDAISINQMNDREKTHQVGQMNLIYSLATQVIVWLGLEDSDSSYVFRYHDEFERKLQASLQESRQHLLPTVMFPGSWQLKALTRSISRSILKETEANTTPLPVVDPDHWHTTRTSSPSDIHYRFSVSVEKLLGRPWFRRIWVYPEVFLAPRDEHDERLVTVVIGSRTLRWSDLVQLTRAAILQPFSIDRATNLSMINLSWFQQSWDWSHESLSTVTLAQCVYRTRGFSASDPRDKIFALLHLAQDTKDCICTDSRLMPYYERPLLDIILKYVGIGILLVSEVKVSEHGQVDLVRLDFNLTGRVLLGDDHAVTGRRIACVERFHGSAKAPIPNAPKVCKNTFKAIDGRSYAVNCFLAPRDEIITCHAAESPFVITPYPVKEHTYLVRGPCLCYPISAKYAIVGNIGS